MKIVQKLFLRILLIQFILILSLKVGFAQENSYNCYLKNINQIDSKNLEFDIWLEWTGTNSQLFRGYQAGIDFNYTGIVNGGTITGALDSRQPGLRTGFPITKCEESLVRSTKVSAIEKNIFVSVRTPLPFRKYQIKFGVLAVVKSFVFDIRNVPNLNPGGEGTGTATKVSDPIEGTIRI